MYKVVLIVSLIFLAGCQSFHIDRYSISPENALLIRENFGKKNIKFRISSVKSSFEDKKVYKCGGIPQVYLPDDLNMADYFKKALESELKLADSYDEFKGVSIDILLNSIESKHLKGKWIIKSKVQANGKKIPLNTMYSFNVALFDQNSCLNLADHFPRAVQTYIKTLIKELKARLKT